MCIRDRPVRELDFPAGLRRGPSLAADKAQSGAAPLPAGDATLGALALGLRKDLVETTYFSRGSF
eukprot:4641976-Alexandrium_andersonii.AAC.1